MTWLSDEKNTRIDVQQNLSPSFKAFGWNLVIAAFLFFSHHLFYFQRPAIFLSGNSSPTRTLLTKLARKLSLRP
jgi:hypothetical protein